MTYNDTIERSGIPVARRDEAVRAGEGSRLEPELIQGGMGVAISSWELARVVAVAGERLQKRVLGVVSGIGLATTLVFRLQRGDVDTRRALDAFPVPEIAREILDRYWLNTKRSGQLRLPPKPEVLVNGTEEKKADLVRLLVVANFAEVWLAKQGHRGPIGINYLEKIQLPRLPEMFGAMLAGVDYILMGAGIPNQVPGALDELADWKEATCKLDVAGSEKHALSFDPKALIAERYRTNLTRPKFLAIVSHHALAQVLAVKATGEVNGFVVEGPIAGGHNAPARGKELSDDGEPIYGERDKPDLAKIRALGKPFWLAGGHSSPEKLREAKSTGAVGIQVGSAFALCDESGMRDDIKQELRRNILAGDGLKVLADPVVSPSGFPFQVVSVDGSLSDPSVYARRKRSCSLGYIAQAYTTTRGGIGFRCPAEPVQAYVRKGGSVDKTERSVCICNGLAATSKAGYRKEANESYIVTLGQDHSSIRDLLRCAAGSYSAEDVVRSILV